jgi:hypothetical protein
VTYSEPSNIDLNYAQYTDAQHGLLGIASGLQEDYAHDVLGAWLRTDGKVVMVTASDKGTRVAQRAFGDDPNVEIQAGHVSQAEIGQLATQLHDQVIPTLFEAGQSPETGGMFITLSAEPTDDQKAALETFAEEHGVTIRVEINVGGAVEMD